MSVIDTATNTVTATIPVGVSPAGVAVTPDGHPRLRHQLARNTVSVIDTATNTVTATVPVGTTPIGVAVTPDGRHAYVTNRLEHCVGDRHRHQHRHRHHPRLRRALRYRGRPGAAPSPSLTITKSHTGNFVRGRQGTYTITVGNNGTAPTNGTTVTVQDTLPAGLNAASITGSGWSCTRSTLTCTRSSVLAVGSSYPPITLRVQIARNAPASVTNTATVTGGGDTTTHTATDPTTITGNWNWNWNWDRPPTAPSDETPPRPVSDVKPPSDAEPAVPQRSTATAPTVSNPWRPATARQQPE